MSVVCLNCDSPEFALEDIQCDYDYEQECYREVCPLCGASHAFAWEHDEN